MDCVFLTPAYATWVFAVMFAEDRNNAGTMYSCMPRLHASYVKCAFPKKAVRVVPALSLRKRASCSTANQMGDAANAHQRNIYNKKIPTLEYVDGQVR